MKSKSITLTRYEDGSSEISGDLHEFNDFGPAGGLIAKNYGKVPDGMVGVFAIMVNGAVKNRTRYYAGQVLDPMDAIRDDFEGLIIDKAIKKTINYLFNPEWRFPERNGDSNEDVESSFLKHQASVNERYDKLHSDLLRYMQEDITREEFLKIHPNICLDEMCKNIAGDK